MSQSFDDLLDDPRASLALRLVRESGALLREAFFGAVEAADKGERTGKGYDPVTAADRAAEERMRALLRAEMPGDGVIGEEFGEDDAGAGHVWVIDPIDGTRAFLCGLPTWTVLVALLREGRPALGLIHQPVMDFTVIGNGESCWRLRGTDATPARVRPTEKLEKALCGTTLPKLYDSPRKKGFLRAVTARARHVQFDADALFYAQVACGRMDAAFDTGLALYDTAALAPVITGAGGGFTDWRGNPAPTGGDVLAAATPELQAALLRLLDEPAQG